MLVIKNLNTKFGNDKTLHHVMQIQLYLRISKDRQLQCLAPDGTAM
jgi:hypothetical protein